MLKERLSRLFRAPLAGRSPSAAGPAQVPQGKQRICMLAYTFYESDNRVLRYAKALIERGDEVDVIALASDETQPAFEVIDKVNVHRIQRRQRNEQSKYSYLARLVRFCLKSSVVISRLQLKRNYDLIHVHNVPDFLVFSAWLPKLLGAKIILDIHDILPEFFANKFRRPESSAYVRALKGLEWLSARFSNHLIISNHLWHGKIIQRAMPPERCSVFINYVDLEVFSQRRTRADGRFILLYHGGLQRHQGLDLAIRAFAQACPQMPGAEFHIYGGGNMKPELEALVAQLGLKDRVFLFESMSISRIAEVVANADVGVVAKRADSFGNEAYSTKIMEYMASGVPVIVSRTKVDTYYFNDEVVRFFESGSESELAEAMIGLMKDSQLRESLRLKASQYAARNSWNTKKREYWQLVDSLTGCAGLQAAPGVENSAICR